MRKFFSFVLVILLLIPGVILSEDSPAFPGGAKDLLETPAPARIHAEPEPTAEPPAILNRTQVPDPLEGFRFKLDSKMLHIWFPNIQDCDEAVIMYDDNVWLIDCASEKAAPRGVEMMARLHIPKIEKLFNTHPHYDHIQGLQVTNESVPIDEVLFGANFPADTNESMITARAYAEEACIDIGTFSDGETFAMGDGAVTLTFYYNEYTPEEYANLNERSLINHQNDCSALTLLQYGDRRMLFMADMERNYGQANFYPRLQAGLDLSADVLKYPHHGNNGMLYEFWKAVDPKLVVITNHRGTNKPGIEFLTYQRVGIFYTNYPERYVHLYTDGHTWVIEYVPLTDFPPLQ